MQLIKTDSVAKKIGQNIDKVIGERIRQRRTTLGLSQKDVSSYLGITYQQFQKYEKNGSKVSASRLFILSKILGVEISYFYEGVDRFLGLESGGPVPAIESHYDNELRRLSKAYSNIENDDVREAVLGFVSSFEKKNKEH